MKLVWVVIATVLAAGLAAGCGQRGRQLGPLTPKSATPGGLDTGGGTPGEEVNPVRTAPPATLARPRGQTPARPSATLTRPDQDAAYEARLDDVTLPMPGERTPILADPNCATGAEQMVNTVLAQVNSEVITREDILGPLRPQMTQWRKQYTPEAFESRCRQVVNMKLREAISQRLVIQEAEAELTEQEKEVIDLTLGQTLKNLATEAGSMLLLEEKLKLEGSSITKARDKERERMLVQRHLRKKIAPTIHVTHSELLDYYNQVRDERYVVQQRARLALIAIKKSESADPAQARALADAVQDRASGGEDFARLAKRYSQGPMAEKGGDWGFMTKGAFRVKAVNDVLFSLETGQVGPLVEADDVFYVVKCLERQQGRTIPFTEVQDELEDEIRDKKYNAIVADYISDLYQRSYVKVMIENL